MAKEIWAAIVTDEEWGELEDTDLEELCEKLDGFWDELLRRKLRHKVIDRALKEAGVNEGG